jgi:transcriptional regulator with XRE-family HTH domain
MEIGDRIKQRRNELGWSLRELSNRMGYANHSTIARIESGAVDIPQSKVVKFAEVLHTSVAHLMGWDESPEDLGELAANVLLNPKLLRLVQNYLELEEADQDMLSMLAENLHQKTKKG